MLSIFRFQNNSGNGFNKKAIVVAAFYSKVRTQFDTKLPNWISLDRFYSFLFFLFVRVDDVIVYERSFVRSIHLTDKKSSR